MMLYDVATLEIRADIINQNQDRDAWLVTQGITTSKGYPVRTWLPKECCKMFVDKSGVSISCSEGIGGA